MSIILVAGALANKLRNGGGTWERMSWAVGLRRLGFEVYFVEQMSPAACVDHEGRRTSFHDSVNLEWFRFVTDWFGLGDYSALICGAGEECAGVDLSRALEIAGSAELLVNLSGHLALEPLISRIRRKAYIDVDPGFTQFWHADPKITFCVAEHDHYFTIGENIGSNNCPIPTSGIHWQPTRQPVVLDDWPVAPSPQFDRFTTVAGWRGPFGPVQAGEKTYGLKVHEFRKFITLPQLVSTLFEIALDIHPADEKDRLALEQHGWRLVNPREVAGDAAAFRHYVQGSAAEFSVAQGVYVDTNSGWFSDRTVRYLASGKPALVQETGFSRHIPTGRGLVSFRSLDEAVAGAEDIAANYDMHCRAAREIAEAYFDSDKVLKRLLDEVGVAP